MTMTWLDCVWVDRHGRPRVVAAPETDVDDALGTVRITAREAGWDIDGRLLRLAPDVASRRPSPWDPRRDVVLCDLLDLDGTPSDLCPRVVLKRALSRAVDAGYRVVAAAEVEFHLTDDDGEPVSRRIDNYGIVEGAGFEDILRDVRALDDAGVPVTATNPEYGGAQFEVNLRHEDALQAADAVTLLRSWIGVAARRGGLRATFAAKPWPDGSGSGLHLHQSLWRGDANAFFDAGGLSREGEGYLAGLLGGITELTPLGSPTPSAYRRRSDGSFCPTAVCWSGDNRTVAVRVLTEEEAATRIEQRDAAANANAHLALAGQLTAGLRGIEQGLVPPAAVRGNAYGRRDLPTLPRTLHEALDAFAVSSLAVSVLGKEARDTLIAALTEASDADLAGRPLSEAW
jgi:glutamine synthetase